MEFIARADNSYAGANHLDFVKGIKHLQRRDRIVQVVLKGLGDVGNDQPIAPAYGSAWCKEANDPVTFGYDPDKAKFHLQKSGLTGAELKVAEVNAGLTDMSLLLQRECAKIGFDLQLKRVPTDGYWSAVWNKDPFCVGNWNARPTANSILSLRYASDAAWNDAAYRSDKFDRLLQESRRTKDAGRRHELDCDLQRMITSEAGSIIPVYKPYVDGVSSKVKGLRKVPIGPLGGSEWPETAWIEA